MRCVLWPVAARLRVSPASREEGSGLLRDYELVVIVNPDVPDEELPNTIEKLGQLITGRGGEVAEVDHWGRRKLAYPIRRYSEGNYVMTQFKLDPTQVADLEASLELTEEVIRHLVVRVEEDEGAAP
jgi:small subunit ribosomal protein S6